MTFGIVVRQDRRPSRHGEISTEKPRLGFSLTGTAGTPLLESNILDLNSQLPSPWLRDDELTG